MFHFAANVTLPQGKRYTVRNMTNPDFVVKETTLGEYGVLGMHLVAMACAPILWGIKLVD